MSCMISMKRKESGNCLHKECGWFKKKLKTLFIVVVNFTLTACLKWKKKTYSNSWPSWKKTNIYHADRKKYTLFLRGFWTSLVKPHFQVIYVRLTLSYNVSNCTWRQHNMEIPLETREKKRLKETVGSKLSKPRQGNILNNFVCVLKWMKSVFLLNWREITTDHNLYNTSLFGMSELNLG